MKRWQRVAVIVMLLFGLAEVPAAAEDAQAAVRPPNIVLIVADDLGWNDVGYHGSEIETPHIDRLAREGLELDRFYVQPSCSPTRAALMTGKSPLRLGVIRPIAKVDPGGLPIAERLLPQFLATSGYQAVMSGKWHLGSVERRYFPHRRGFESFYGHVMGGIGYWDHNHGGGHDWQRDGRTLREAGYTTHLIANEAQRLLRERDGDRPTFLYVAFNAPHTPNEAPVESITRYAHISDPNRRIHAAMVSELDSAIGRILQTLDEEGMRRDTLVWFLSDNGGLTREGSPAGVVKLVDWLVRIFGRPLPFSWMEFLRRDIEAGASDNTPLRGGKTSAYEGGVRVPAALRWPGVIQAGRNADFITAQDLLPTLLEAIGELGTIPSGLDGRSRWSSLLTGTAEQPADYAASGFTSMAYYRWPWKLLIPGGILPFAGSGLELYQVLDDPSEEHDLSQRQPEMVETLRAAAEALPRGDSIHASLFSVLRDPDSFGGPEDREPWADVAR